MLLIDLLSLPLISTINFIDTSTVESSLRTSLGKCTNWGVLQWGGPILIFAQSHALFSSFCGDLRWIYILGNYFYVLDAKYLPSNHLQMKLEGPWPLRLLSIITYSHFLCQDCLIHYLSQLSENATGKNSDTLFSTVRFVSIEILGKVFVLL